MIILGPGGLLNDPACAVLKDGALAAAVEQKKVSRHHEPGELPEAAISAALQLSGVASKQVDCIALVRPFAAGPQNTLHLPLRARFPTTPPFPTRDPPPP